MHRCRATWLLVGLLACSESRPDAEAETEAELEAESEVEAEAEAEAEPEIEAESELAYTVVPPPPTFFFVDRCFRARGATVDEALEACRRERPRDRWCRCDAERVLEASPERVSLYHGCCGAVAATPQLARKECQRRIDLEWCDPDDEPPLERIDSVYGPYERLPGSFGEFDDEHYRYVALGAEYPQWVDETGEPPCFPDGTSITLDDGARAIEDVRVGDRVVAMSDVGDISIVPVIRVKTRRADELVHIQLGTHTLRVTPLHPLLVDGEWMFAGEVEAGDQLTTRTGHAQALSVERVSGSVRVHSLSVGAPHTYFADGVLAHNY